MRGKQALLIRSVVIWLIMRLLWGRFSSRNRSENKTYLVWVAGRTSITLLLTQIWMMVKEIHFFSQDCKGATSRERSRNVKSSDCSWKFLTTNACQGHDTASKAQRLKRFLSGQIKMNSRSSLLPLSKESCPHVRRFKGHLAWKIKVMRHILWTLDLQGAQRWTLSNSTGVRSVTNQNKGQWHWQEMTLFLSPLHRAMPMTKIKK